MYFYIGTFIFLTECSKRGEKCWEFGVFKVVRLLIFLKMLIFSILVFLAAPF